MVPDSSVLGNELPAKKKCRQTNWNINKAIKMVLVFISYETTTGLGFSKHLQKSLKKHDISSFVAEEDIAPGKAPFKTIQENLKECRYFVLVLTINAFKSPEVRNEFSLAKELDKYIIPCVKEGLESYIEKEFKEVNDFQYIQFKTKEDLANCVVETILKQRIGVDYVITIISQID